MKEWQTTKVDNSYLNMYVLTEKQTRLRKREHRCISR